jgi:tetratricopeptide (TPR) repeat protein
LPAILILLCFFQAGRLDDALKAFTQAIDSSAVQGEILASMLISRSDVLQNMKRFDDAIEDCTRVISLNNDNVKAYLRRAALFEKKNDNQSAARDYEQAKRIDPENPGWSLWLYFCFCNII